MPRQSAILSVPMPESVIRQEWPRIGIGEGAPDTEATLDALLQRTLNRSDQGSLGSAVERTRIETVLKSAKGTNQPAIARGRSYGRAQMGDRIAAGRCRPTRDRGRSPGKAATPDRRLGDFLGRCGDRPRPRGDSGTPVRAAAPGVFCCPGGGSPGNPSQEINPNRPRGGGGCGELGVGSSPGGSEGLR